MKKFFNLGTSFRYNESQLYTYGDNLRDMGTVPCSSLFLSGEKTFVTSCLLPWTEKLLQNGAYF